LSNLSFFRKELKEILRTSRLIVVFAVFIFFSIFSAIGARYINEIIASMGGGIKIEFPDPTYIDSWAQFFKNVTSICLIVFLLIMTGTVVSEKTKGSIMLVLSKNVTRSDFILSKTVSGMLLFTAAYAVSAGVCAYYTYLLFGSYSNDRLIYALFLLWLLGLFLTALGIYISTVAKSATSAAILGFAAYAVLNIPTILPEAVKYTPAGISSLGAELLKGTVSVEGTIITLVMTVFLTIVFTLMAISRLQNQEI
jgi:ABC-2 type transport system permease protein